MSYTSAALVIFSLVFVLRRSVSARVLGHDQQSERVGSLLSHRAVFGATDLVITAWVVTSLYAILLILKPPLEVTWPQAALTIIPLVSACAAMERYRWSRYALLGMAALILMDSSVAAARVAIVHNLSVEEALGSIELWQVVLSGFTGSPWFGLGVVGLAAATLAWLTIPVVNHAFEHRKKSRTRRHQFAIAGTLVAAYFLGLNSDGLYRSVENLLTDRAQAAQLYERIAMRTGATISPGGRR